MTVTKDSIIGDVLNYDAEAAGFFLDLGMHCLGCPAARSESIADASAVHGIDADNLVKTLNEYFAGKE